MAGAEYAGGTEISQPRTTAIQAGWICFGLGALTFWIFGIGMVFFSAAFIFGIVAMATHEVRRGLVLFSCSVAAIVLIPLTVMFLGLGVLGYAATKASAPGSRSLARLPTSVSNAYAAPQRPQPVHDYLTSSVESFMRQARLSAVMSGNPAIAVINGKDYEVGQDVFFSVALDCELPRSFKIPYICAGRTEISVLRFDSYVC